MGHAHQKRILVIEDDSTYARLWGRLLKEMGFPRATIVNSAKKALKIIKKENFDLMISDVTLSTMNGYLLAQKIRELRPYIEVLLTTGYQTDLSRFDLKSPKFHLLHKPYHNLDLIRQLVGKLLNHQNPQKSFY